jgi:2-oxoglutarate dehydrogenase E2 component (dihydrolipoamide succinyltransferase)
MSEKILVPVLGESITEATVAKWLKNKGDSIETDEPLVELETDKVNLEVPSPVDGILSEINANNGQVVEIGTILGLVTQSGEVKKTKKEIFQPKKKIEKSLEIDESSGPDLFNNNVVKLEKSAVKKQNGEQPLVLNKEIKTEPKVIKTQSSQTLSPAVRKIVEENKIDIKNIEGSGKDGRLTKGDVIRWMSVAPKPSERKVLYGHEERIKMTRLRMTIAKRLKQAQETAAMLTTFNEVDMHDVIEMRKEYQEDFQNQFRIKLGFMSFFVKACVIGLKNFPAINAEIDNEDIVYKNYYNISFAVGTEKGLVVPVLRNSDELSFADIEKNIKNISEKARDGKLTIEDLQDGTFTISNGGVYGSMLSTPILNAPQSGILGMHNIIERPVVVNGEIKIRPMMYLALSYDHRIIDGKDSVSFLKCIKENLEDPRRLFLDL